MSLTDEQAAILDFEKSWWRYAGAKETAVRETFGMSFPRYFQALNAILELPEAMAYDPFTVKRLLRLRDARAGARSASRLSGPILDRMADDKADTGSVV